MKTITLSADEDLIEAARQRAEEDRTTLNAQFQLWLADYAGREGRAQTDRNLQAMRKQQAAKSLHAMREVQGKLRVGRKLTREEMNER